MKAPAPWLFARPIDLLLGAGGLALPLALVTPALVQGLGARSTLLFPALALVCNYPHYFATLHRAYRTRLERERYRLYTRDLTLLIAATGALVMAFPVLLPAVFTAYLTWSPWHYSGQNYGIGLLFLRRQGAAPTRIEARCLKLAFLTSSLIALTFAHRAGSRSEAFWSLELPASITPGLTGLLLCFHVGLAAVGLVGPSRRHGIRPMLPVLLLLLAQGVWFTSFAVTLLAPGVSWAPRALGMGDVALLHCAQYLWILAWFSRRESAETQAGRFWPRYTALLIAGGIALWLPIPWASSRLGGLDFETAFLTCTALINLHHFVLDGALWRMRDVRVSRTLGIEGATPIRRGADPIRREADPIRREADPIRRGAAPATSAWGLALPALLGIAGIDLVYRYHQSYPTRPDHLGAALALNPSSAGLHSVWGLHQARLGDLEQAIEAHHRALELNPRSAAAHHNLGLALAEARGETNGALEAEAAFERAIQLAPGLYAAHLSLGILAARRGDAHRALEAFEAASRLKPAEVDPWLRRGLLLDQLGRVQDAGAAFEKVRQLRSSPP